MKRLKSLTRSRTLAVAAATVLVCSVVAGGVAMAASSTTTNAITTTTTNPKITACVGNLTGIIRIPTTALPCNPRLESTIVWNQTGPQGPAGAAGVAGPAGPQGPAGQGITNFDSLRGMACNVGTPQAGTISISYVSGGQVAISCNSSTLETLSVTTNGPGTVTSNPPGINCGSSCSSQYSMGASVVLTATPSAGGSFTGWSGACSGTSTCTVTMTAAQGVTANFVAGSNLSVSLQSVRNPNCGLGGPGTDCNIGSGSVGSAPDGVSCTVPANTSTVNCTPAQFPNGSTVVLTETPGPNSHFNGWTGDCSGTTSQCTLTNFAGASVGASWNGVG
jgi:hypothetical protein